MKKIVLLLAVMLTVPAMAQKIKVTQGSWENLSNVKAYNLEFDYTNLMIPKYDSEEEFLKDKMQKREEKKAGDGERFKQSWFADRDERYKPKFIESFNKRFDENELQVGEGLDTEYTMKIHSTMIYPGYNVGVMRQNSKLEATIYVYKTDDPSNILFAADCTKVEGSGAAGYDFNSGYRISEAYAKLAKGFAKNLKKKAL